jgi:hypothetical protein
MTCCALVAAMPDDFDVVRPNPGCPIERASELSDAPPPLSVSAAALKSAEDLAAPPKRPLVAKLRPRVPRARIVRAVEVIARSRLARFSGAFSFSFAPSSSPPPSVVAFLDGAGPVFRTPRFGNSVRTLAMFIRLIGAICVAMALR